jgi:exodeoxyribonuclease V alpha subunit
MAGVRKEMTAADAGAAGRFPETVYTIHRLLGASDTGFGFHYHENRHLPADVIIIDEASMVSLSLMAGLFAATDQRTRLVLLGDKNQLASVEAGAVLGDICGAAAMDRFSEPFRGECRAVCGEQLPETGAGANGRLTDCIVELKRNFRFPEGSALAAVGSAVNRGDPDETIRIIDNDTSGMVVKEPLPEKATLEQRLLQVTLSHFQKIGRAETVDAALEALEMFRIVCAHRQGVYGVETVNRLVEKILAARGVIDLSEPFYRGRPVMIIRNDYAQRLYNGDVGLIWADADGNRQACFPDPLRRFRMFSPLRLPPHETVYAMTIHKSQGSEFDSLLMILPEKTSPVLTRELIYTGLTRARKKVTIWAGDDILKAAVAARVSRRSGLRDALGAE